MKVSLVGSLLSLVLFGGAAPAAVPLPDHLLFGTIAIDGRAVTKANTDTTIEARRSAGGPVLASYRMGAQARLGDYFYALRVPVTATVEDAGATQAVLGDSLVITVRAAHGIAFQVVHRVLEPGVAQRLDFGADVDTNGDGIADSWEMAHFGATGIDTARDTDGDGADDRGEYFAGTDPRAATDVFRLALQEDGASVRVSFRALRATGAGVQGRTRYYALETASDPVAGPWRTVPDLSRIVGADQWVAHAQPAATNGVAFFRARVWLE